MPILTWAKYKNRFELNENNSVFDENSANVREVMRSRGYKLLGTITYNSKRETPLEAVKRIVPDSQWLSVIYHLKGCEIEIYIL